MKLYAVINHSFNQLFNLNKNLLISRQLVYFINTLTTKKKSHAPLSGVSLCFWFRNGAIRTRGNIYALVFLIGRYCLLKHRCDFRISKVDNPELFRYEG